MESSNAGAVFADLAIVDRNQTDRIIRYFCSGTFHVGRLRYGWMPAHPTFFVKRALYEQYGGYSLRYRIAADFEMIARLLYRRNVSYAYLPAVVVKMRAGGISTSGLKASWVVNTEMVRACRENGIETSLIRVLLKVPAKLMSILKRPPRSS